MTPVSTQTVTDALRWRYATKKFDPERKIPAGTWAALEQALVLAPSSYGLQPWRFVVVQDEATREKLSAAAHGQRQPLDCSHFVVFSFRKDFNGSDLDRVLARTAEVRGVPRASVKGYGDVIAGGIAHARSGGYLDNWMSRQVYIALGGFIAAASLLGVDSCPMEGIEAPRFDEILGLTAPGYGTLCACAAGYRAADDKYAAAAKVRFRPEDVIVHV
jgi:nitroreductase